ncbi:MAG: FlgD immunoglobulin-like domain containing protein [bacterium]
MSKRLFATLFVVGSIVALIVFWRHEKSPRVARRSGALEALQQFTFARAYPNDDIPSAASFAAFEFAQKNLSRARLSKVNAAEEWQSIGPHNRGGRTLALASNPQNPNTIYAGSASGGLWRSFTAGRGALAWERVPTGFPVLAVSSIAFAPNDSNTIYIGTGEVYNAQGASPGQVNRATRGFYGIGILKSTDGGASWRPALDWSYEQQRGVWAVKINPLNRNTIWAATTMGTYKSTDAGATWRLVHPVSLAMDLVIHPTDTNTVLVSYGNFASTGYGLYRTTNGGAAWQKTTLGLLSTYNGKTMLALNPSNPNTIYASFGNGFNPGVNNFSWLTRSTDSGASWQVVSTQDYSQWQAWYSHDIAVNPSNPNEVFAIGINVWKSTNGGSILTQKSFSQAFSGQVPPGGPEGLAQYVHVDLHDLLYHPTNHNVIYFACDGGVFRTIDGGETFEACNGGYQTTQFYNGFASSQNDSNLAIGGLQDNNTVIYKGTTTWSVGHIGGDGGWAAIDPANDEVLYGTSQFLNLSKSLTGGRSWFNISPPGNNRITIFEAPFVVGFDNPNIIYAGRDLIYKSVNGGSQWATTNDGIPLDGNPAVAMAISQQNSSVVYVATAPLVSSPPRVFRTRDGGSSWQFIAAQLPNRVPTDLAVNPNDDRNVYITYSGFGTSHVFKSNSGGDTWQNIGIGLPDVPTNAVIVDPLFPSHVYVGTDLGVYVSTDGGNTWQDFNAGVRDGLLIFDLSISNSNRKLRAVTHGNGVYERALLPEVTSEVESPETTVTDFTLEQNYPNPFNPQTTIAFTLQRVSAVDLKIYTVQGREVRTVMVGEMKSAGRHQVHWDGKNTAGQNVVSGVYVYRLAAGAQVASRRMTLMR